jgi:hypothetical protein|eukprot:evm.model.NODE_37535_length_24537_cov_23.534824.9
MAYGQTMICRAERTKYSYAAAAEEDRKDTDQGSDRLPQRCVLYTPVVDVVEKRERTVAEQGFEFEFVGDDM